MDRRCTGVTPEQYLHISFEYDAEYVEGRVVLRPEPKKPHSRMQSYLDRTLYDVGHPLGYEVWPSLRVRTQPDPPRYRVPDVCLTKGEPEEDVFTEATGTGADPHDRRHRARGQPAIRAGEIEIDLSQL